MGALDCPVEARGDQEAPSKSSFVHYAGLSGWTHQGQPSPDSHAPTLTPSQSRFRSISYHTTTSSRKAFIFGCYPSTLESWKPLLRNCQPVAQRSPSRSFQPTLSHAHTWRDLAGAFVFLLIVTLQTSCSYQVRQAGLTPFRPNCSKYLKWPDPFISSRTGLCVYFGVGQSSRRRVAGSDQSYFGRLASCWKFPAISRVAFTWSNPCNGVNFQQQQAQPPNTCPCLPQAAD